MLTLSRRYCGCGLVCSLVIAAGCSTHPLPEDVTGLPIFQIVHRIECEAADTVKVMHRARDYTVASRRVAVLDKKIEKASKRLSDALDQVKSRSDYGTTKLELEDAFDSINLQIDQVLQKISKLESELVAAPDDQHRKNMLETLKNEAIQLDRQYRRLVEVGQLFVAATRAGAGLAQLRKERRRFKEVIDFEGNAAVFQFVFQVTENNNGSTAGTITWPITTGVITLGYGAGEKRKRSSDRQVKLVATFGELNELPCGDVEVAEEPRLPLRYPITGEIGLNEVISDYMTVATRKGQRFQSANDSYRDKITFTTAINGSLNPGINLSKRMGQLIQASIDLNADRTDVHELTIFLTPPGALATGGTQELIIRQVPPVRVRAKTILQSPAS